MATKRIPQGLCIVELVPEGTTLQKDILDECNYSVIEDTPNGTVFEGFFINGNYHRQFIVCEDYIRKNCFKSNHYTPRQFKFIAIVKPIKRFRPMIRENNPFALLISKKKPKFYHKKMNVKYYNCPFKYNCPLKIGNYQRKRRKVIIKKFFGSLRISRAFKT